MDHGFPPEVAEDLVTLLKRFPTIISQSQRFPGTRTVEHRIVLKYQRPIRMQPYRVSDEKKQIIEKQVSEMLKAGIITPSTSPYSSRVVLVPKKDGTLRLCVVYRRLNEATESEPTSFPIIQVLQARNSKYLALPRASRNRGTAS